MRFPISFVGKRWQCTYLGPKGFRNGECMMYKEREDDAGSTGQSPD